MAHDRKSKVLTQIMDTNYEYKSSAIARVFTRYVCWCVWVCLWLCGWGLGGMDSWGGERVEYGV